MACTLLIDVSDPQETVLALENGSEHFQKNIESKQFSSETILPTVESLLLENDLKLADISEISCNYGTGSFTETRVAVSIANTLAFILGISVNNQTFVMPTYLPSKFD